MSSRFIEWYERDYRKKVLPHELLALPEAGALRKFITSAGFFRTLPVIPGAVAALERLVKKYEVYIVSAAMEFPQSLSEKLGWLGQHFPFISWRNIIFCGDKSIIGTDIMIDDHLKNLDVFKGETYLFTASHNVNVTKHTRLNNWEEAVKVLYNTQS